MIIFPELFKKNNSNLSNFIYEEICLSKNLMNLCFNTH